MYTSVELAAVAVMACLAGEIVGFIIGAFSARM